MNFLRHILLIEEEAVAKKNSTKKKSAKQHPKSHPFSFQNPEESIGFLFWQVTMIWQRRVNTALQEMGLVHTEFVVLAAAGWLTRDGAIATQTTIANHAQLDKMMTSKTLRSLEKQGWIKRTEHQTDTRAKIVTLTSSGETALQKALHIVEARDNALFDILGEQRESFADQLRTIWREGLKNG